MSHLDMCPAKIPMDHVYRGRSKDPKKSRRREKSNVQFDPSHYLYKQMREHFSSHMVQTATPKPHVHPIRYFHRPPITNLQMWDPLQHYSIALFTRAVMARGPSTVPSYCRGEWPIGPKERQKERERELSALHFFLSSTPVTKLKNTRLSLQHYLHRAQQKFLHFRFDSETFAINLSELSMNF